MVRDLAERGVLEGHPGSYSLRGDIDDVDVPATLQATIGARIDRLDPVAKRTLNAAAVIGSRFDADLLASLVDETDVAPLIAAELVDQVRFGPLPEYAFRHPLDPRCRQRIAAEIRPRATASAPGRDDRRPRSGLGRRERGLDRRTSRGRRRSARGLRVAHARRILGQLPRQRRGYDELAKSTAGRRSAARRRPGSAVDAHRTATCCARRDFAIGGSGCRSGFDELRELCIAAGDQRSLAIGMSGPVMEHVLQCAPPRGLAACDRTSPATRVHRRSDLDACAVHGRNFGQARDRLRCTKSCGWPKRGIDLAGGDATKGGTDCHEFAVDHSPSRSGVSPAGASASPAGGTTSSRPLRWPGPTEAMTRGGVMYYTHTVAIMHGVLLPSEAIVQEMTETLADGRAIR